MGGRDKGANFRELHPYLAGKVKRIIVLGEAADRIQESLSPIPPSTRAHSLDSAVSLAHDYSQSGDTVLLAPGCASFDMFTNFEERGDTFKQAVNALESQQ
jgi:UDP-N-acetylmuramoylalanine--D-glutamate ligase